MSKKNFQNILIIFFFLSLPFLASAQELGDPVESVGLTVNQSVFSFDIDPGGTVDFKIAVENISEKDQRMSLYVQDLSIENENEIQILENKNELQGMKDWIKFAEPEWILKSGEKKETTFSVAVPSDATVGSHYAGIFFQAFPPIDAQNFQRTIVSGRVGSYVLVNVKGEVSGKGNLTSFQAPLIAGKKEEFQAEFENTGNVHYIPHGEIRVKNLLTRKEKTLAVEKHFVFPGKKYAFDINWDPESIFGAYRAAAYFVDGEKTVHVANRFVFGKLFFGWIIIIVAMIFAVYRIVKKRKKDV